MDYVVVVIASMDKIDVLKKIQFADSFGASLLIFFKCTYIVHSLGKQLSENCTFSRILAYCVLPEFGLVVSIIIRSPSLLVLTNRTEGS